MLFGEYEGGVFSFFSVVTHVLMFTMIRHVSYLVCYAAQTPLVCHVTGSNA